MKFKHIMLIMFIGAIRTLIGFASFASIYYAVQVDNIFLSIWYFIWGVVLILLNSFNVSLNF